MKKLTLNLKIIIGKIEILDGGYYEIHYKYQLNDDRWENDMYDSDFDNGMTPKQWKKELENGVALENVLQKISEEISL
jgi:hypothetical protein